MSKIYQFEMNDIFNNLIKFDKYKGFVLLIVNVASKCGNTKQYADLQAMYDKYKDKGLRILGFPCNQFFMQEPKSEKEIYEFCTTKYNVTFDMFSKVNVNGKDACELYTYLKESFPWTPRAKNVKWNFEKFLIDRNGNVVNRIGNKDSILNYENQIVELLNQK